MSRAIISGKRLSKLQGKDACNTSEQSENEATPAYSSQTVQGKFNCGEKFMLDFISFIQNIDQRIFITELLKRVGRLYREDGHAI